MPEKKSSGTAIVVTPETREKIREIQKKWASQQSISGIKVTQKMVIETLVDKEYKKIESEEKWIWVKSYY